MVKHLKIWLACLIRLSFGKKAGLFLLLFYIATALFAPRLAPYKYNDFSHPPLTPPSKQHLLGTDELGRDLISILIYSFRPSLYIAGVSALLATALGQLLAFLSLFSLPVFGMGINFAANLLLLIPEALGIIVLAVYAPPRIFTTVLAIVFFTWPRIYRVMRVKLQACSRQPKLLYTLGLKGNSLDCCRVLWPDIWPLSSSFFLLQLSKAVGYEATLSFFGLGAPLVKTWGKLVKAALDYNNLLYDRVFLFYLLPPIGVIGGFIVGVALLLEGRD